MQMRAHDEDRSVYRNMHFMKSKTKNDADHVLFAKVLCQTFASDNFELELQSSVSNERSREDRRFFKHGMKFSMEAN